MSAAEILSELPKLTEIELRAVRDKLAEMAAQSESKMQAVVLREVGQLGDDSRRARLKAFFAEWDATHSTMVGEKPTRERTYADNPRIR